MTYPAATAGKRFDVMRSKRLGEAEVEVVGAEAVEGGGAGWLGDEEGRRVEHVGVVDGKFAADRCLDAEAEAGGVAPE